MITIKEIKENIKCPQFGDTNYGKWGMLKLEQRLAYKELIEQIESADNVIKNQYKEIERLTNIINKAIDYIETYTYRDDNGFYAIEDDSSQLITILRCGVDKE